MTVRLRPPRHLSEVIEVQKSCLVHPWVWSFSPITPCRALRPIINLEPVIHAPIDGHLYVAEDSA
jgi:hypothetical protein